MGKLVLDKVLGIVITVSDYEIERNPDRYEIKVKEGVKQPKPVKEGVKQPEPVKEKKDEEILMTEVSDEVEVEVEKDQVEVETEKPDYKENKRRKRGRK